MLGIKYSNLNNFLSEVSKDIEVYAPIKQNNTTDFRLFEEKSCVDIDTKTSKSPKNLFFCAYENIVDIKRNGKNFSVSVAEKKSNKFVIFGIKPCDQKSFDILDNVFLSDPCDEFYKARRQNAIIMTMACNSFEPECFCTSFKIEPYNPDGDIVCYKNNDYIVFVPKTDSGKDFLNGYIHLLEELDFDISNYQNKIKDKFNNLPLKDIKPDTLLKKDMMEIFNDERWTELSATCLGCGSCTFFCPTCQCYDIRDFKTGDNISRYRCWDSCMYSDFTTVAGGGNPRKTQKERFRQRFMHKLVYYPMNYNSMFSCVGCGRCLKVCPNHLNIVKVIKKFGE